MKHRIITQENGATHQRNIVTAAMVRDPSGALTPDGQELLTALAKVPGLLVWPNSSRSRTVVAQSESEVLWPWPELHQAVKGVYCEVLGWEPEDTEVLTEVLVELAAEPPVAGKRDQLLCDDE